MKHTVTQTDYVLGCPHGGCLHEEFNADKLSSLHMLAESVLQDMMSVCIILSKRICVLQHVVLPYYTIWS